MTAKNARNDLSVSRYDKAFFIISVAISFLLLVVQRENILYIYAEYIPHVKAIQAFSYSLFA